MKKVLIIANPGSGKGEAPTYAKDLSALIHEVYHADVSIRETTKVGDATTWAREAQSEGYDTVLCLGGDGTVNEVVNGLMAAVEPPLFSFIPMGTANDLGRVLGFDMKPDQAVEQFRALEVDRIDIGQVNDHYFMDVVAIGDIPTAVMETDSEQKNQLGFFAYVVDSAKAIVNGEDQVYKVTASDGEIYTFSSSALAVALTSSVGSMEQLIPHRTYKDGQFQFIALKGDVVRSGLETLVSEGGIPEGFVDNEVLLAFSDTKVKIEQVNATEENLILSNVDGDEGPALPLEIQIHKQALKVWKPKNEA